MPGRRPKRSEEERKLYTDLELILIPTCSRVYETAGKTNNVLVKGLSNTPSGLPSAGAMAGLISLCGDRCSNLEYKIDNITKNLQALNESGLDNNNIGVALGYCNEIFDDFKTSAELVGNLGGMFLGLKGKEEFDKVYDSYMQNLSFYANKIAHDKSVIDGPYFSLQLLIFLATLGIKPYNYSSVYDFVKSIKFNKGTESDANKVFTKDYIRIIHAESFDLDRVPITPVILSTSEGQSNESIQSEAEEPETEEKKIPPPTSLSTPPSHVNVETGFAKDFIGDLIDHCGKTWKDEDIDVDYLRELGDQPEFYKRVDSFAQNVFAGSGIDYESEISGLLDYIDCSVVSTYLNAGSRKKLSGVGLRSAFSSLLNKIITCAHDTSGNPDLFARCMEGENVSTSLYEEAKEEAENLQRVYMEGAFTDVLDNILDEAGLKPVGSYDSAKSFVNYFISLLKKYGLNTDDYSKLTSVISKPEMQSDLAKIVESIPESYRKQILSKLATLISSISSYPPAVQTKALDLFTQISQSAMSSNNQELYFDALYNMMTQILHTFPNSNDRIASFMTLDKIVKVIDKFPESERDNVLFELNYLANRTSELRGKYPVFSQEHLKRVLHDILDRLELDLKSATEGKLPKEIEKKIVEHEKKQEKKKQIMEQKPLTHEEEETEETETISNAQEFQDIIVRNAKRECKFYLDNDRKSAVKGPCIYTFYFKYPTLQKGTPMLLLIGKDNNNKVYTISGKKIIDIGDKLVRVGQSQLYNFEGMIGTNMFWIYTTSGTEEMPAGTISVFLPYIKPNTVAVPISIYSLQTLPIVYINKVFKASIVTDEFGFLVNMHDNQQLVLVVPTTDYSIKEGDIYKVIKTSERKITLVKWGEEV